MAEQSTLAPFAGCSGPCMLSKNVFSRGFEHLYQVVSYWSLRCLSKMSSDKVNSSKHSSMHLGFLFFRSIRRQKFERTLLTMRLNIYWMRLRKVLHLSLDCGKGFVLMVRSLCFVLWILDVCLLSSLPVIWMKYGRPVCQDFLQDFFCRSRKMASSNAAPARRMGSVVTWSVGWRAALVFVVVFAFRCWLWHPIVRLCPCVPQAPSSSCKGRQELREVHERVFMCFPKPP